ncbi:MAG: hypothetical protein WCP55_22280 [Lentisphaerota bacterium]
MNCKLSLEYWAVIGMMLLLSACASTPQKSAWYSPTTSTVEQVYKAALMASVDNGFIVDNQNRVAGLISLKKEEQDGDGTVVHSMSVKITQFGNKILVSTNVSGNDAGIVEGTLGKFAHRKMTRTFYDHLFRELEIADPNLQNILIEDAR